MGYGSGTRAWRSVFLNTVVAGACILSGLLALKRPAYGLDPSRALTQYLHRIWQTPQGLPAGAIRSILQTSDGYVWLGTDHGLVRFDGVRFTTPADVFRTPLASAQIRQVAEDAQHSLWIATNGAGLFRLRSGVLTQYSTKEGMPSDGVFCVVADTKGGTWACTGAGMVRIDRDRIQAYGAGLGSAADNFQAACQASDGTIWAGGEGSQLSVWDGSRFSPRRLQSLPPYGAVQAMLCGRDGTLWVGTTSGLIQLKDGREHRMTTGDGLANNSVLALSQGRDGSLWVGTNDGFSRFRNGEFQNFGAKDGLSQSIVFSLYEDREGSLWAGTKRGLNQFLDRRTIPYTTSEGLPSNDTGPVLQDANGNLWVGSLGAGLARLDGHHRWSVITRKDGLSSDSISALARGASGELWVGSEAGLDLVVSGRVKRSLGRADGLPSESISSLYQDREGTLWIGTVSGAAVLRKGRIVRLTGAAAARLPVVAFAEDGGGRVLVATQGTGLSAYTEGSLREIPERRLAIRNVDALYGGPDGVLWVGTLGSGLMMVDHGKAVSLSEQDGLFDDDIYGIIADDRGHLWMAGSKGIFSVNRADLKKFKAGFLKIVTSTPYSLMDGLQTLECRSGVHPAVWRLHDGHLCFSMIRGLLVINPDQAPIKLPVPQVAIESITVDGRRVNPDQLGQMSPGSKNLAFIYTALSFHSPQRITFRYILEGFDQHWTEANTRRQAFYTNLPPGSYRFRVTACNFDGTCNETGASVAFAVPAPFYQRPWFIALCLLLIASLVMAAYRVRIQHLKQQFEAILGERIRIARELHDTLIQGFSGVTMQMQALATRLSTYESGVLDDIIHDAANCLIEARRSVADLRREQPKDSGLAAEIERTANEVAAGGGMKLKLHLDRVPPALPPGVEFNLVRIAKEAITNSVKHSRGQIVKVGLRYKPGALRLLIEDDGLGFTPGPGSDPFPGHYGLIGMRERAEDIGAEFAIHSEPGAGTAVHVAVPVNARADGERTKAIGELDGNRERPAADPGFVR